MSQWPYFHEPKVSENAVMSEMARAIFHDKCDKGFIPSFFLRATKGHDLLNINSVISSDITRVLN